MSNAQKVLIVGGGFGGVKTALELANNPHFKVTLLSDSPDFRYYPTLYHTATGGSRANSSISLLALFHDTSVKLIEGTALSLDRQAKTITTTNNQVLSYDELILGLGVVTNYFGIPGLSDYAYGIKSQTEAARFKRHLHDQLTQDKRPDLNYIIVGAGPTGIELAGALPSYLKRIIKNHQLPEPKLHIDLVEAMPRLLPNLPSAVSGKVRRRLKRLGIRLYLSSKVEGETADSLSVNGKPLSSHSVVWTAGVTNHPFFMANKFVLMGRGKVAVDAYLQAEPGIYVIGDNANTPYSGMAQTALHDGLFVADNLDRKIKGHNLKSYLVKKPITVIPAGPNWAVVLWGKLRFSGFVGYLLRETADFKGFHDLESWPKATMQLLSEFIDEDDCQVCALAMSKYTS